MLLRPALALIAALTIAAPADADDATPPNTARDGDFRVIELTTDDSQGFEKQWTGAAADAKSPATTTKANKPLFTYLVFAGCKADDGGNCDVSADFTVYGPDGKVTQEQRDYLLWNQKPAAKVDSLMLGRGALGFGTDDDGPFGDYRIVAKVTDKVAGVSVTTEQTVTVQQAVGPTLPG